jgi:hypothetical protein
MALNSLTHAPERNHQNGIGTRVRENAIQEETALQAVAVTELEPVADP